MYYHCDIKYQCWVSNAYTTHNNVVSALKTQYCDIYMPDLSPSTNRRTVCFPSGYTVCTQTPELTLRHGVPTPSLTVNTSASPRISPVGTGQPTLSAFPSAPQEVHVFRQGSPHRDRPSGRTFTETGGLTSKQTLHAARGIRLAAGEHMET